MSRATRAYNVAILPSAILAAALLASCAPRSALVVESPSEPLRQELAALAREYFGRNGIRITPSEGAVAAKGAISIVIGWGFPADSGGIEPAPVPNALLQEAGFGTALAFERWAREGEAWRELPILWDAWGFAITTDGRAMTTDKRAANSNASVTFTWKDREGAIKAGSRALASAGESGVRQSLFWFMGGAALDKGVVVGHLLDDGRSAPAVRARFGALAALAKDPLFTPGSDHMMKGDVENLARNSGAGFLYGDYQWTRRLPGAAPRDFVLLAYPSGSGYAIPASILAGRVVGSGAAAAKAQRFLVWLLSPQVQRRLSDKTGYMAANFNASNLDPNGLKARAAAIGALSVVPIDPEPARGSAAEAWDSLLGRALARPTEWEKTMAEGMGKR